MKSNNPEMQQALERTRFMLPKLYPHADPKDIRVSVENNRIVVSAPRRDVGVVTMDEDKIKWTFPRKEFCRGLDCGDSITVNDSEYIITSIDRGIDGTHSSIILTKPGVTPTLKVVK